MSEVLGGIWIQGYRTREKWRVLLPLQRGVSVVSLVGEEEGDCENVKTLKTMGQTKTCSGDGSEDSGMSCPKWHAVATDA